MPLHPLAAASLASPQKSVVAWLLHLGGIGLIPLGVLDSSVVPIPGSMDFATILLSARDKHLWFYYAFMATAGSFFGCFLPYPLLPQSCHYAMLTQLYSRIVHPF